MAEMVRAALVQAQWAGDKDTDDQERHPIGSTGGGRGSQGRLLAGTVQRSVLLPGARRRMVRLGRAGAGRTHDPAVHGRGARERHRARRPRSTKSSSPGVFYNTAAVIDADGRYLGKHRKNHIPQVSGFWEKFYFRPGNLGYPVFDTAVGRIGVYICYERHFPEGWRALGLGGAKIVFNPSATSRGLSEYLWRLEQPAAAVANEYFVGTINRVGVEPLGTNEFYGQSYFVDPRGPVRRRGGLRRRRRRRRA